MSDFGDKQEEKDVQIPTYLSIAVRIGIPSRDVYQMLEDVERRFIAHHSIDIEYAQKWARREALFFLMKAGIRLFSPSVIIAIWKSTHGH